MVSIVIPARNEETHIGKALTSIAALDYPRERIEVIVVDNGSTDRTARIAHAHGVHVLHSDARTVGQVRNAGVSQATGEIIAFVDADCMVPASWLRAGVAALASPDIGAVGNERCLAPADAGWVEKIWAGVSATRALPVSALATSSFIIRRELFEQLGGFNTRLSAGEDDDLSARIRRAGYTLLALPECTVTHLDYPHTLRQMLMRQLWHGRSQLQTARGYTDRLLILTHVFAFCALGGAISFIVSPQAGMSLLTLTLVLAMGAAWVKRRMTSGTMPDLLRLSVVFWFFLLGRTLGLLGNYKDLAFQQLLRQERQIKQDSS